jgi:two-component system, OmpR family, phosphate regulon sensor histidine kinase PhoR
MVNTGESDRESNRVRALVAELDGPLVVLDEERRLVAASPAAAALLGDAALGRRVPEDVLASEPRPLVLFLSAVPALSAYQELRAGFTAAVSHELRTPLARLLVLLESTTLPGADIEALVDQAREEIEQTRDLIDDVLFLGELEAGREVVALGSTLALPLIEEIMASYADRAEHAQVRLVIAGGPQVELPLRPRMLRVIVENLVANSIRYAGAGSTCTVTLSQGDGVALLSVADDGDGVREAELSRLFERFYRSDQARSSRGTGLGLAIVKHVVTSAGGTVEARRGARRGLDIVCRFGTS